jgi:hypothetical protein
VRSAIDPARLNRFAGPCGVFKNIPLKPLGVRPFAYQYPQALMISSMLILYEINQGNNDADDDNDLTQGARRDPSR